MFAPFFGPHVDGVEDGAREIEEVRIVEPVQDLLMESAPHTGPRPDHEVAMRSGLRCAESR